MKWKQLLWLPAALLALAAAFLAPNLILDRELARAETVTRQQTLTPLPEPDESSRLVQLLSALAAPESDYVPLNSGDRELPELLEELEIQTELLFRTGAIPESLYAVLGDAENMNVTVERMGLLGADGERLYPVRALNLWPAGLTVLLDEQTGLVVTIDLNPEDPFLSRELMELLITREEEAEEMLGAWAAYYGLSMGEQLIASGEELEEEWASAQGMPAAFILARAVLMEDRAGRRIWMALICTWSDNLRYKWSWQPISDDQQAAWKRRIGTE